MERDTVHSLQIDGVTKRYGRTTVVQDLTFEVQPGRVTGFLGPNGAGKSTTMKVLLGLASESCWNRTRSIRDVAAATT
jgi:ABC-2 type transport system ATP-binding protein